MADINSNIVDYFDCDLIFVTGQKIFACRFELKPAKEARGVMLSSVLVEIPLHLVVWRALKRSYGDKVF